jgi:hypothetical protein
MTSEIKPGEIYRWTSKHDSMWAGTLYLCLCKSEDNYSGYWFWDFSEKIKVSLTGNYLEKAS